MVRTARGGRRVPSAPATTPRSSPFLIMQGTSDPLVPWGGWFGAGDILPPALLGNNNHDQVANEVFWDFFSRFRL